MTSSLKDRSCTKEQGDQPVQDDKMVKYLEELSSGWMVLDGMKISKDYRFGDFMEAMAFVNMLAMLAEREGHHPDISIFYNAVRIQLWTHSLKCLSENDFIMAAKIEDIFSKYWAVDK